ncbi:MAG TPA: lysylphosphatidylglycerol synthase domain-containing protein [Stellaceae bacterium]|nr:lysylphosphatidylglycerol synthase domain-containing protein [Stellaceae bacterium]
MKAVSILALLAGMVVTAALVAVLGAGAVFHSFLAIGWKGFLLICLIHLCLIAVMGIAWRSLVPGSPVCAFLAARIVREAGSEVLPLSPIGGCVLGARVLILSGIQGAIAAASTIVDLTLEFFAKLGYTALGLVLLVSLRPHSAIAAPLTAGLAAASLAAVGFVAAQRRGLNLVDRIARVLGRGWAERTAAGTAALADALRRGYQRRQRLWVGFYLHLFCWIAATLEAWVALQLLGNQLPFKTVLVLESLLYAVRTFAVVIPNAVGLQEGAYVLIGAGFGLAPETALVVSLVKRARDLAIGLPALGVWQFIEAGRVWRRRKSGVDMPVLSRRSDEVLDRSKS